MSVLTPGYILDISDESLLINGQAMPFGGRVEDAIQAILGQLSQLTMTSSSGLSIVIRDSRPGGFGEVTRTIPPGSPVSLDSFAPVATAAPPVVATPELPSPEPEPAASVAVPAKASVEAAEPAAEPAAPPAAPAAPPAGLSIFAQLAQGAPMATATLPGPAVTAPEAPAGTSAYDGRPEAVEPTHERVQEPVRSSQTAPAAPVPVTTPVLAPAPASEPPVRTAPTQSASPSGSLQAAAAALSSGAKAHESKLAPAPMEEVFDSIFKEDAPIVDEGIRTPLNQSLTARQRTEGFSLKSQARREVERRSARKRKVTYTTIAAITLVAALRIVGAVMAGPSGDYAAICVDARTMQRQPNGTCSSNANPFAQVLYYGVGEAVPAVGSKASGGATEKPRESRVINTDVPEGTGGTVLDGAEVK